MAWKRSSVRLRYSPQKSAKADFFIMQYFVYILFSEKCNKYYVGHTDSVEKRVDDHNKGKGGKFSSNCLTWKLVYSEEFLSRSEAMKREREIKNKKSRKYIEWLIDGWRG
jgi:putative endonuclease